MTGEITCDVCGSGIAYPVCFQLNPCSCRACVRCFHQLVPSNVFNRCPRSGCKEWITSSTLLELEGARNQQAHLPEHPSDATRRRQQQPVNDGDDSGSEQRATDTSSTIERSRPQNPSSLREVQEVPHFQPDEQMDPFRHWAIKKPTLYTGFLYVAYRSSKSEASFYKSNFRAFDSSIFMDDNSTDEMVKIFARILHPLMFQRKGGGGSGDEPSPSRIEDPEEGSPDPSQHEHNDCYRRQDRQHLAMRCLYALSSGRVLTRAEQEENFGGTTKNPNQRDTSTTGAWSRRATQRLAKELLGTYQKSCLARKNEAHKPSPSPVSPPPSPVVHDLRFLPDDDSEHPQRRESSASCDKVTQQCQSDGRVLKKKAGSGGRAWENELGLNETSGNDDKDADASSPVVPAIIWILSAVFILSK